MGIAHKSVLFCLIALMSGWICYAQNSGAKDSASTAQIAGTWRGNSVCLVKNSPCRDEVNVYRFSRIAGRANSFSVTASKVVDDREVMMGSSECAYKGVNHAVECKSPDIRLVITGNKMEGNLTLSDGTPYRLISLQKKD